MFDNQLKSIISELKIDNIEIFEFLPQPCCIIDKNYNILKINRNFRERIGDFLGESCFRVLKNRDTICVNCPASRTFEDGNIHQSENFLFFSNDRMMSSLLQTSPLKDKSGKVVAVLEMITDISRLKVLESEVHRRNEAYHYLFDRVPCYISVQDREFHITQMNRHARLEFGDRIGEHCYNVYKRNQKVCTNCPVKQTFSDGSINSQEETIISKSNREIYTLVQAAPLRNEDGDIISVMEIFTDITEVKKLQQELVLVGQVVAEMAHQIKNILMGLEGGTFVVQEGLSAKNGELVNQGWKMVQRNINHISKIVKDLLYCSKERQPEYELKQLNDIVKEIFDIFNPRMIKESIQFHIDLDPDLPEALLDRNSISMILSNLVSNALDACLYDPTREDHCINIKTRFSETGYLVLTVTDNGMGMDSEWKGKIFNQYVSSKGNKGTGLGLMVVNKAVKEHGGSISVESEPGVGTIFEIHLPYIKPEESTS